MNLWKLGFALFMISGGTPAGADTAPLSVTVRAGTSRGGVAGIVAAGDNKILNLYSNRRGKLRVEFKFPVSRDSKLVVRFRQKTAGQIFNLEQSTTAGWVHFGQLSTGNSFSNFEFSVPVGAVQGGMISIRIDTARGTDDCDLDYIALTGGEAQPAPAPMPEPAPMPAPTPAPAPQLGSWKLPPAGKVAFDWQISVNSDSNIVPPTGAQVMDVDVFSTSAQKVAELKSKGIYTICYINAGSYQPGLPDSSLYPDYLKIQKDPDWPGEYFLDVTDVFKANSVLARILRSRFQLCKDKGFDAVEPDNLQNDENVRGGLITTQQQLDFNGWVADTVHEYGLAVFQKNGPDKILSKDRTGKMMVEKFDGILNEECQRYNECQPLAEYVKRGKLAIDVEYDVNPNCSMGNSLGINIIRRDLDLVGGNMTGYKRVSCP
ncbi:MAG: endo alpha-1,4 polygalactosaminidase [Bdellovibrionales bacterium]